MLEFDIGGVGFFIFVLNDFEKKISSFCALPLLLLNWGRGKNVSFFLTCLDSVGGFREIEIWGKTSTSGFCF